MSNKLPKIDILYEDAGCLVVNKPAGLMVHGDGRDKGPFLTDWILNAYPEVKGIGDPARTPDGTEIERSGIVHRLDRETSGALLIAKTAEAHARLKEQFQSRTIRKKYLAFVWGDLLEEFGTISRPIGRSNSDFRKWSAQRGARGEMREAETYWTNLARFREKDEKFTLVEVEPKTGRTHQIRVHFLAIHHPVVGDHLYAPKHPRALGFQRTALHARSINFATGEGKIITVQAPLPKDFTSAIEAHGLNI